MKEHTGQTEMIIKSCEIIPLWLRVEDELPKEGVEVLTWDGSNMKVDYIVFSEEINPPYIWARELYDDWATITHWMPLPDHPK